MATREQDLRQAPEVADAASHQRGTTTDTPSRGGATGSTARARPALKMKRTGKVGMLLPSHEPPPAMPLHVPSPTASRSPTPAGQETDYLQIEGWEAAPGLLRSCASGQGGLGPPENIAFSRAHLASQGVRMSAHMVFRVEVLLPGVPARWQGDAGRLRICSVAAGKVRVRIQGEPEFAIGRHGVFRVPAGRDCAVENRLYGDAVLHISEIPAVSSHDVPMGYNGVM